MSHALLSPSSASRWWECPPSARLGEKIIDKAGVAAEEGTLAHSLAETILERYLAEGKDRKPFQDKIIEIQKHPLYTHEMSGHIANYVDTILSNVHENSVLFVETKLDITDYVPEAFGTADATIITGKLLDFWDLKYGKGVEVSAIENKQLMLYALGAISEYGYMFDLQTVRMNIYQPRMNNHSSFSMEISDLIEWGEKQLIPKAKEAFEWKEGKGGFKAGEHCRFCKVKASCRAFSEKVNEMAKVDFSKPSLLSDEEILSNWSNLETFKIWLKAVHDYVYAQALGGKKWEGLKLVEGKSNRVFKDPIALAKKLESELIFDIYQPQKLLGITALQGAIGKEDFNTYVNPELIKPKGKPTLVPEDDKRPVMDLIANDFSEPYDDFESED